MCASEAWHGRWSSTLSRGRGRGVVLTNSCSAMSSSTLKSENDRNRGCGIHSLGSRSSSSRSESSRRDPLNKKRFEFYNVTTVAPAAAVHQLFWVLLLVEAQDRGRRRSVATFVVAAFDLVVAATVAVVTIEDLMEIEGFKIINGSKGLFVSVPSHKGTVQEDGVSVEKYFDDVRFPGEAGKEFGDELKAAILTAYHNDSDSTSHSSDKKPSQETRASAAAAHTKAKQPTKKDSKPPRERKPLWGY